MASADELVAMGFERAQVEHAIQSCGGNADLAVEYLLNGGGCGVHESGISGSLVVGPISQYSVENGRSACTCISLAGATLFLNDPSSVTPAFLQQMVLNGVSAYQQLSPSTNNVEHVSAEEVIAQNLPAFPLQLLPDGIRQGVLSSNRQHPLGLGAMLQGCHERSPENQWTAVLITKVPETIVICLPPSSSSGQFWLIDSHPRPQLPAESAYAKSHSTIEDLVQTLQVIFPVTDLGPDIPEMMTMMYNSFDLYLLVLRENGRPHTMTMPLDWNNIRANESANVE